MWRAPIAFLSTFIKHRYLFQGPNSTKMHSGITPLNFRPFSLKIILVCNKKRLWNTMRAPRYIELLLKPIYPQLFDWVIFLRPSALRFTNYSYIQIKTSKNWLKSQVSHRKCKSLFIEISRMKQNYPPTPMMSIYCNKYILSKLLLTVKKQTCAFISKQSLNHGSKCWPPT